MTKIDLRQGDCLELMKDIPDGSVDMVLTDPPYGTTACKWDNIIPFGPMWVQIRRITKKNAAIVLFGMEPFSSSLRVSNIENYKYDWIWRKSRATGFAHCANMPLRDYETISVFSYASVGHIHLLKDRRMNYYPQGLTPCNKPNKRGSRGFSGTMERDSQSNTYITKFTSYPKMVLEFRSISNTVHPTQKPVALLEYLIKTYTNEGETVLDFTMGSGTTGVACINTSRNFIGIERDDKYFEIAKRRIEELQWLA